MKKSAIAALFLLSGACQAANGLNSVEQSLVDSTDQYQQHALALLEKTVNINSGTLNLTGVKQIGDIYDKEFKALGFKTQWIDGKAFERAGHFVAEHGTRGPKILMIGHLDTVFAPDSPLQRWQPMQGNRVRGPGINDNKGGNTIALYALKALKDNGLLDNLQIRVLFTGDEELRGKPMALAAKAVVDGGKWADIALGFENGDGDPATAVTARRGASRWSVSVAGKAGHSSRIFSEQAGYGAAFELARVLNSFRELLADTEYLTFNPGLVMAGDRIENDADLSAARVSGKGNIISQTASASGDLRALSPSQLRMARTTMLTVASQSLPGTKTRLTFTDGYPPMAPTPANERLLAQYSRVSIDLGDGPITAVNPMNAGAADISFAAPHVDMALDGLGMMGGKAHSVGEYADLDSLQTQIKRTALLLYRLSQPDTKRD